MRGLVSFLFLLGMVYLFAALIEAEMVSEKTISRNVKQLLKIEKMHSAEMEIRNVFLEIFKSSRKDGRDGVVEIAELLNKVEKELEGKYLSGGVSLDLWFGGASHIEIEELREKSRRDERAYKCENCFDFDEMGRDYDDQTVPLSSAFLSNKGGKIMISKRALSLLPETAESDMQLKEIYFGASLYFGNMDATEVVLMPGGFG